MIQWMYFHLCYLREVRLSAVNQSPWCECEGVGLIRTTHKQPLFSFSLTRFNSFFGKCVCVCVCVQRSATKRWSLQKNKKHSSSWEVQKNYKNLLHIQNKQQDEPEKQKPGRGGGGFVKNYLNHPQHTRPGARQRHHQASQRNTGPCASRGGSKPAGMANVSPAQIEKHGGGEKYTATRTSPSALQKTKTKKTCKMLINRAADNLRSVVGSGQSCDYHTKKSRLARWLAG